MLPSQEEALRIKKRVPPNTTEEQRWNEVYLVLFPEEHGALPSPCKFSPQRHRSERSCHRSKLDPQLAIIGLIGRI